MYDDKTQMLVMVGGALTGLSSGVFLAAHSVPCVVIVERHSDLLIHPLGCAVPSRARSSYFAGSDWSPHPRAASYVSSDQYAFAPIRAETLADEE